MTNDALAVLNGFLFFWGQWFSVPSVRKGDLVVHSSALGWRQLLGAALMVVALGMVLV